MTLAVRHLLLGLGLLFLLTGQARAKDITLAWDKNSEPDVVGYKVYYKAESSAAPLNGWGANEGDSPIIVGNLNTAKISGLMDSQTYYFAVSAFNATGVESPLSDIVASAAVPALVSPSNGAVAIQLPITFRWDYAPFTTGMSYTLLIGTDPKLPLSANQLATMPTDADVPAGLAGLFGFGLLGGGLAIRRNRMLALMLWAVAGLSLAACGGGGGSADGVAGSVAITPPADSQSTTPGSTTPGSTTPGSNTQVLSKLTTPFATIANLQPGTTYYWQVYAIAADGYRYESLIHSFTTTQ